MNKKYSTSATILGFCLLAVFPAIVTASETEKSLHVTADGNVGLGTDAPAADLHIKDSEVDDSAGIYLETNGQSWSLFSNASTSNFVVQDALTYTKPLKIGPGAPSNSLFVGTTGIGVGTNTPDEELDIEGDGPGMRFTNTGTDGGGWRLHMNGGTGRLGLSNLSSSSAPIRLDPAAAHNLLQVGISPDGISTADTVSIGSINAGDAILHVQGSIVVDGVTEIPDYVFEPDYELAPIASQLDFMRQQKHLPSMPKAPEGFKGPVDLVAQQMGMLEELEKAHLYIGQLHERLEALAARVEELESD